MGTNCQDFEKVGYCLRGSECIYKHGNDLIELDVNGYDGLIEAKRRALNVAAAQMKEQQNELARKQTDLLSNLVSQQRALIQRIELCTDETEKLRLKSILTEMSEKTKSWIEQGGQSGLKKSSRGYHDQTSSDLNRPLGAPPQQASSSRHS